MTEFLIPLTLLFGPEVNACACKTWLQLASLADESGRTPPLDLDELVRATGKSRATLYRHLGFLKQAGVLDWTRSERVIRVSLLCQASAGAGGNPPGGSQDCASQFCELQFCDSQDYAAPSSTAQDLEAEDLEEDGAAQVYADPETGPGTGAAGVSILCESHNCESQNCESQNCECASLKYLSINRLINLTREEARFPKSRILSKSRNFSKTRKIAFTSQKCANDLPVRGPPGGELPRFGEPGRKHQRRQPSRAELD